MIEKSIYLESIDPVILYGVNNILLNKLSSSFPKLKIVARGHEVIVIGDEKEIILFEEKLNILINFYHKYNKLTIQDLEDLLNTHDNSLISEKPGDTEIIVHGNHGKDCKFWMSYNHNGQGGTTKKNDIHKYN